MARPSGRQARIDAVMALMGAAGSVRLRDAAARLGVTEMTLRRDVVGADAPLRCLGGWLVPASVAPDYDLPLEMDRHVDAKRAAARAMLARLDGAQRIFVDCGTTTLQLAPMLSGPLTVVTSSLPVAQALTQGMPTNDITLHLLGGRYNAPNASFVADPPLPPGLALDLAIISAGGIDGVGTVSCSHAAEVAVKQAAMARAERCVLLADRSKLGLRRPYPFARREDFDDIVTEAN